MNLIAGVFRPLAAASLISAAAALGAAPAAQAAPGGEPPRLNLVLTPQEAALGVRMEIGGPPFKAGEAIVRLPLKLVGIPTARYDNDALQARDDKGPLNLVQDEEPPTPQGVYRRWKANRDTAGAVVVTFAAPPRLVTAATNNGPLFDLRREGQSFLGAGVGFMATPARPTPYRVHLHWVLPAGWKGVWSLGNGDVDAVVPSEVLAFSFYAAGLLNSYPATPDPNFGLYWASPPPFSAVQLGERVRTLHDAMARFFGEQGGSYRVFMRQNPYHGTGGTALASSFMFGYNAADKPTLDKLQGLLSHEMAHNWPAMQGEHGDTAWYSEGTAEYYSALLSYRAGVLTTDALLKSLNEKAYNYYTNPYRALTNAEAARIFWTDPTAQTIPYGRGLVYLARTDEALRASSGGKRSLDDVVITLRKRQKAGESYGIADWLSLVGAELGPEVARRDYDAMVAGSLMPLPVRRFAPCFLVERHDERLFELGFDRASLGEQKIRGLVRGSAAAKAGVRDGDVVVEAGDLSKIRSDPSLPMTLTLKRGGETVRASYLPLGKTVEAWRWRRNARVPHGKCVL